MISFRHRRDIDPELQLFFAEILARQDAAIETSSPRHRYFDRRRRLRRQNAIDEPDTIILDDNIQFSPYKQPLPSVRYTGLYATSTPKTRYRKVLTAPAFERMYPPLEINPAAARLVKANRRYKKQNLGYLPSRVIVVPEVVPVRARASRLRGYRRPLIISSPVRRLQKRLSREE